MLLNKHELQTWLEEDLGQGDLTTQALIDPNLEVRSFILAKEAGCCFGLELCSEILRELGATVKVTHSLENGKDFEKGQKLLELEVNYAAMLKAERLSLNLLQRLCGIATMAKHYQSAVAHTRAKILDTRKTTPGLRRLEKAAVLAGGAYNHRFGLYDQFLIKENHMAAFRNESNPFACAIKKAKDYSKKPVIIEVENLSEVELSLEAKPEVILLDNMSLEDMKQAVELCERKSPITECEASGGITIDRLVEVAETGVHRISVGAITHSAPYLDLSMLMEVI
jgi:nicotinate-nucleotide pyrophosphorylase (carboxylating)